MEEIKRIKALLAEDRPGDWESLPDIDLYMDQVLTLFDQCLSGSLYDPGHD